MDARRPVRRSSWASGQLSGGRLERQEAEEAPGPVRRASGSPATEASGAPGAVAKFPRRKGLTAEYLTAAAASLLVLISSFFVRYGDLFDREGRRTRSTILLPTTAAATATAAATGRTTTVHS